MHITQLQKYQKAHLCLRELQLSWKLCPLCDGQVLLLPELLLEAVQLLGGEGGPWLPGEYRLNAGQRQQCGWWWWRWRWFPLLPVWFVFSQCTSERTHWWTNICGWKMLFFLQFVLDNKLPILCLYLYLNHWPCWQLWWKCQQVIRILQTQLANFLPILSLY